MEATKSVTLGISLLIILLIWAIMFLAYFRHKRQHSVELPKEETAIFISDVRNIPPMTIRVNCNKVPRHNRTIVAVPELTVRGIIYSPPPHLDSCDHCIFWGSIDGGEEVLLD